MFKSSILRQAPRLASHSTARASWAPLRRSTFSYNSTRSFSATQITTEEKKGEERHPGVPRANDEHEGTWARTDHLVRLEHPEEHELPESDHVQGRGGVHFRRTLASFSLEGNVGVVTGGARGLGLVMSQALVLSGADVAIVDMNRKYIGGTDCAMRYRRNSNVANSGGSAETSE